MSDEEQTLNQLHIESQKSNSSEQDKTTEDKGTQYAGNVLESWETLPAMDKGARNALFDLHADNAKAAFDRGVSMAEIHRYFQKLGW